MLKNKSFSYSQTSIWRSCTLNLDPTFLQSVSQINLRPGKKKADLSVLHRRGAQEAVKFNEMTMFRKLMILKVTDMGLPSCSRKKKKADVKHMEEMGTQKRWESTLVWIIPCYMGLKVGTAASQHVVGLLCVVRNKQMGSKILRGSYDLLYHHTLHDWNKTCYIASYRTHSMEVIRLLCMFLKIIKISLNDWSK